MLLEGIQVFVVLWWIHLAYLVIPSLLIYWFTRKFAHYEIWECLVFILPFAAWFSMLHLYPKPGGSGLGNLFDWKPLAIAIPVSMLIRSSAGKLRYKRLISAILLLVLCLIAIWSHFHFPPDNHGG